MQTGAVLQLEELERAGMRGRGRERRNAMPGLFELEGDWIQG